MSRNVRYPFFTEITLRERKVQVLAYRGGLERGKRKSVNLGFKGLEIGRQLVL